MIWSREDINFNEDDLAELNRWAELHGKRYDCEIMKLALEDKIPLTYIVEVDAGIIIRHGISCQCGEKYFVGDLEPIDLWGEEFVGVKRRREKGGKINEIHML